MKGLKYSFTVILILLILLSFTVSAGDNAPPALPSEYWGKIEIDNQPAQDGMQIIAEVNGVDYSQGTPTTKDGYYNILLVGGDRELTYIDDPDCSDHWNRNPPEACIPCSTDPNSPDYCIEGPKDGKRVILKVDGHIAKPYIEWNKGMIKQENISAITRFSKLLTPGWNLFSLPIIPLDNSLSNVLSSCEGKYEVVWTTTSGNNWRSSKQFFNPLNTIEYGKSYLIYMNSECNLVVEGYAKYKTTISVTPGWNLVGYPSIETLPLIEILSPIDYSVVWTTTSGNNWRSSKQFFNPLTDFSPGGGYESYINTGGEYNVIY